MGVALDQKDRRYVVAFRWNFLTPMYDLIMRVFTRDYVFKLELVRQAHLKNGGNVLDIGCGTGTLTIIAKKACPEARVVGIDGDPRILRIAKSKMAEARLNISLEHGMASTLPHVGDSFDRILASMVLHHLTRDDRMRVLREALRVLKPGGELHVAELCKAQNVAMKVASFLPRRFEDTSDFLKGLLPQMLHEAGFSNVEETTEFATLFGSVCLYRMRKSEESQ